MNFAHEVINAAPELITPASGPLSPLLTRETLLGQCTNPLSCYPMRHWLLVTCLCLFTAEEAGQSEWAELVQPASL